MKELIQINRTADDSSFFDLQATLDSVTYTLQFRWNVRLEAWFLDVLDSEGVTVHMSSERVVVNYPIGKYRSARTPPGYFIALDTAASIDQAQDPTFDDFGSRVQFYYVSSSELG